MRTQFMKIAAVLMVLFFIGTGISLAKDRKGPDRTPPGHAYGHYKQQGPPAHTYGPRYGHQQPRHYYHQSYRGYQHHYPVVIQKHYYHPPAYYYAPPPSGYFFGFSAYDPGLAFSFGVSGR